MAARIRRRRGLLPVLLVLALIPALRAAPAAVLDKSLFLSVLDAQGRPVKDVQMGDILIREDNQDREVIALKPASQPISVAVLVDTAQGARVTDAYGTPEEYVRDIRAAASGFAKQLLSRSPDAAVMLMEFGQAAITVTKMTSNVADLEKGINRLFPKPNAASVLLESIIEASKSLSKSKTPRRNIVALNIEPGDEQSAAQIRQLHEALTKSHANFWAVSVQPGTNMNSVRGLVLEQLTANTGGRREFIHAQSALEAMMKNIVDNLNNQYEVTYKRPGGGKAQGVLVGVRRDNLKLYANRIPPE